MALWWRTSQAEAAGDRESGLTWWDVSSPLDPSPSWQCEIRKHARLFLCAGGDDTPTQCKRAFVTRNGRLYRLSNHSSQGILLLLTYGGVRNDGLSGGRSSSGCSKWSSSGLSYYKFISLDGRGVLHTMAVETPTRTKLLRSGNHVSSEYFLSSFGSRAPELAGLGLWMTFSFYRSSLQYHFCNAAYLAQADWADKFGIVFLVETFQGVYSPCLDQS